MRAHTCEDKQKKCDATHVRDVRRRISRNLSTTHNTHPRLSITSTQKEKCVNGDPQKEKCVNGDSRPVLKKAIGFRHKVLDVLFET